MLTTHDTSGIDRVLDFWIDEIGLSGWYKSDPEIDAAIEDRFAALYATAVAGMLDVWSTSPRGSLALLILLDQFSRNLFRGQADAFAQDRKALAIAKSAIARGFDLRIPEPQRQFFYLPLMHSETLTDQDRCVRLFIVNAPETGAENVKHAVQHRNVIRSFGRFPIRNAALGRTDSEAELAARAEGAYMC